MRQAFELASIFRSELISADPALQASEAVQEDFGGAVIIDAPEGSVLLTISFMPVDASDFSWILQLQTRRGCLSWLPWSPRDETAADRLQALIAEIISKRSAFRNARWLSDAEVQRL